MHRYLLVRHAAPVGGPDPVLNEMGRAQAESLARRLAGIPVDVAWTSDLNRAAETAAIVLAARDAPLSLNVSSLLREVEMPLSVDDPSYAERERQVLAKASADLSRWDELVRASMGMPGSGPDRTILVVAHAGILRVLICLFLGLPVDYQWRFMLDWAGLSILDRGDDMGSLTLLNDRCHLSQGTGVGG